MAMDQQQWWQELQQLQQIKYRLIDHYRPQVGNRVKAGPFRGLLLPEQGYWNAGDHIAKVFGSYEQCLHPVLEMALSEPYGLFLDIGCADGYYATGFAHAAPGSISIGFDVDPRAQELARAQAAINRLSNCQIRARFEAGTIAALRQEFGLPDAVRLFLKCDIEGEELQLFDPALCASLRQVDLLIELHDFGDDATIGRQLQERLCGSHDLRLIREDGRDPNAYPWLAHLPEDVRWLLLSEGRWTAMRWLVARARP